MVATCTFLLGLMLYGGLLSGIGVKRTPVIFVALNVLVPLEMLAQPSLRRIETPAAPTELASVE